MNHISKCRSCRGSNVEQFFDLGDQPFANALLKPSESMKEHKYPLSLSYCHDCGLVQLDYTADPEELFSNYFWVTGTSSTAREYAEHFCDLAIKHLEKKSDCFVMEVASNDGTFLKPFKNKNYRVLGIDPAENIAKRANDSGITTKVAFFGKHTANEIIAQEGFPDVVFARNVLPHVADTNDFIEGIATCCSDDTLAIIEIHHAGVIADELHYDSIYHEHLCYFTLHSVENLLNSHGLYVYDVAFSPISGGSIVLYIRNVEMPATKALLDLRNVEKSKGYGDIKCWSSFAKRSYEHRSALKERIVAEKEQGHTVIGYGASARSSTMLNFAGINSDLIECIIDKNELKQGLLTPGTHIPIVSADDGMKNNPDTIVLLAWNFRDEIIDYLRQLKFHGKVIVPLPYSISEVDL